MIGLVVWLVHRGSTYHAPLSGPSGSLGSEASQPDASRLLGALVTAVRRDDADAAARLGAGDAAARALTGVVRNGKALRVAGFSLRYVDQDGGVTAHGSWSADVATSWRFAGYDRSPEHPHVRVRFAPYHGRLRIAGIGGGGLRSPLWLSGPLQVRRSPDSLVLVDGTSAEADRLAALARAAVPQVRQVLPAWHGRVVIERPASQQALARVLGAGPGRYVGLAAVTTTVEGGRSPRAPTHVFLNPQEFDPLGAHGAQVVITHETTHVATDAAASRAPIWLVEGFADYVALHAQRLPLTTTAARIIALVRRSGPPRHLPTARELAAGAPDLEARYESAWLACRLLADDGGTKALVAFYRAMDSGHPLGQELRQHFGLGVGAFTQQWRTLLSHLPV